MTPFRVALQTDGTAALAYWLEALVAGVLFFVVGHSGLNSAEQEWVSTTIAYRDIAYTKWASDIWQSPGRSIICIMTRRGNPNWGKPSRYPPASPTEFDMQVRRLGLTWAQYVASAELRRWCERHRNHFYVPEWLLEAWRIKVEDTFSGAA